MKVRGTAIRDYDLEMILIQNIFVMLSLLVIFVSVVNGQPNNSTAQAVETRNDETRPGRLLSKGNNIVPVGHLKVLTYKLEEIRPTRTVQVGNREISLTGFRLTITVAEKLTGGSYRIWIENNSYQAFGLGLYKLGIVMDSTKLPDGATLAVSPYISEYERDVQSKLSVLPERLSVPSPYGYNIFEMENGNNYLLKKVSRFVRSLNRNVSGVEIQIPSEDGYYIGAFRWVIQIGDKEYFAGVHGNILVFWFSDEDFAQLNNGDKIKVKYGSGHLVNGRVVGRLNKSLIQR